MCVLIEGHRKSIPFTSSFIWHSMTNSRQLQSACLQEVIQFQFIAFDVGVLASRVTVVFVFIGGKKKLNCGRFHYTTSIEEEGIK